MKKITDPEVLSALEKLQNIQSYMKESLYERSEEIKTAIIAVLSKQHIIYLGPPGAAKSMLVHMLSNMIKDTKYFEYLLNASTKPGEICGDPTIESIRKGSEERFTEGKLPEAHIAFLDETFKGSAMILNFLLSMMNERKFHNAGKKQDVPLITLFGASNELPEDESLNALYDRFLLRHEVKYIVEDSNFIRMLSDEEVKQPEKLTLEELAILQEAVKDVVVPDEVKYTILRMSKEIKNEHKFKLSDRRYKQGIEAVKAHALLRGTMQASDQDLVVYQHILWDDPKDIVPIRKLVLKYSNTYEAQAEVKFDMSKETYEEVIKCNADDPSNLAIYNETIEKIKKAASEIAGYSNKAKAQGIDNTRIDEMYQSTMELVKMLVYRQTGKKQ